jgi:hypothetical protein
VLSMNQEQSIKPKRRTKRRPWPIIIAAVGLSLTYTVGLMGAFSRLDFGKPVAVVIALGSGALFPAMVLGIYAGRNWARWITVLLVAVGLLGLRRTLAEVSPSPALTRHLILLGVQTACAALLFLPSAGRWFSRERAVA